ncbi:MAG TPA: hypothetical protein PK294_06370 [Ignavibacteria bacterium]|nr:hypothetical protein [Ignavibacteria bacterium]
MSKLKSFALLIFCLLILTGCSFISNIKEKLISGGKKISEKVSTSDKTSEEDLKFYNKYIEVMNKIQGQGENIYKYYKREVPPPGQINKNSYILNMSMQMECQFLGNTVKDYQRSLLDGGELSKLKASDEMQKTLESDLKNLLPVLEEYYRVSYRVAEYYFKREYVNDMSKIVPYDKDMENVYNKYKTEFDKFAADLKKYKPARIIYDPSSVSDPDEASAQTMLNVYGDILESAEGFYESIEKIEYKSDLSVPETKFNEFEKTVRESKSTVMKASFGETVKFMKYHYEDYFAPSAESFINAGKVFFGSAPKSKSEDEFNEKFNELIQSYNKMINSYNTSVETINRVRSW